MSISQSTLIDRFDGTNYNPWSTRMEMYLTREDIWGVVDGSEQRPATPTTQPTWDRKDRKARSDILLFIKDHLLVHVKTLKTSKEVWDILKAKYQTANLISKNRITRNFFTIKMQEGDSMETHINRFCNMQDELTTAGTIVLDAEAAANLLGSLPTSYAGLVMAQTGRVGSLNETIKLLLEEDLRRKGEDTDRSSSALYEGQRPFQFKQNGQRSRPFDKSNQYKRKPFNRYNYNSSNSRTNNYQKKSTITCFHCGKPGHHNPRLPN